MIIVKPNLKKAFDTIEINAIILAMELLNLPIDSSTRLKPTSVLLLLIVVPMVNSPIPSRVVEVLDMEIPLALF